MTGLMLAVGSLLVAAIEVIVLVGLLLVLAAVAVGAVEGVRRGRRRAGPPVRLGAVGVPRQLGARPYGIAHQSTQGTALGFAAEAVAFDGHAIGERLDADVAPGCDR